LRFTPRRAGVELSDYHKVGESALKWVFRIILLILVAFAGLIAYGLFLPAQQAIERSVQVEAFPEDVFPYINNLRSYDRWSPLYAAIADGEMIFGGADEGVGQSMAWQRSGGNFPYGSQEITQSQSGEFVQVNVNLAGREATATHAILPDGSGDFVTVLTKSEIDLGGFPYFGRVAGKMSQASREVQFDEGLARLKVIVEAEAN